MRPTRTSSTPSRKAASGPTRRCVRCGGEGTDTEPKLGTHCWPGKNNALFIAASDDEVTRIKEAILAIRNAHPRSGVKGFILPMEESV